MLQLKGAKCRLVCCLVLCLFTCSTIYLRAKVSVSPAATQPSARQSSGTQNPTAQPAPGSCRPFPPACRALLGGREGSTWERVDCLTETYLRAPDLNCSSVTRDLHFITSPLSREEEEYPLAFILTVHKELETFARLLRAVYAPQNVYCVHVDAKAKPWYRAAIERLAGCFPNVFLASASEKVTYAGFSRLQADINCMRDLAGSPVPWRKVLNLCGQDFPIMSNLELVRYLRSEAWRDRNMTPGVKQPPAMRHRTQVQYREVVGSHTAPRGRSFKKGPPPHGLEIYFGTAYYSLTRGFVDYVLESQVARDLLEWSRDTYSPDEHYWVTLNRIPDAPGNHVNEGWDGWVRAIKWSDQEGKSHSGCKGKYVRDICVYGLEDLEWIIRRESMFANKFSSSFPEATDCMEEWHRQKVLRQAAVPVRPGWRLAVETWPGLHGYVNGTNGTSGTLLLDHRRAMPRTHGV